MNVGEWPSKWAELYPDEQSVKCGSVDLSKREFNERVNQLCHALQDEGAKKGDRVAGLLANGNEFIEILFACAKLGLLMVPLNFRLAAPEIAYIVNDSEPKILIYSPEFRAVVPAVSEMVSSVSKYICERPGGNPDDIEYGAWIAGFPTTEPVPDEEITLDDPMFIMYTSGTTGNPKGAVLTHGNTLWNAINVVPLYVITKQDVCLTSAPMFHIGGMSASATPQLYVGGRIVVERAFNPSECLQLIQDEKVTSMFGIPAMFQMMASMPEWPAADLSSVKYFLVGGAPAPRPLIDAYLEKGVVFNQGYGLTEAAPGVSSLRAVEADRKPGSVGKAFFHVDVQILDENDKPVAAGATGEVVIKGPNVFKEYWRLPDETASVKKNGWFHTGDLGQLDEDGYLWLVDRKKDMFISGGENVYPVQVEEVIYQMPQVAEVAVIGLPDERWGEVGLAIVVPKAGEDISPDDVIKFCADKLAKYKIPKKVVLAETLPRNATGKLLKKDLRAQYI